MTFQKFIENVSNGIKKKGIDENYTALASSHEANDFWGNLFECIGPLIVQISKHDAAYFKTGGETSPRKLKFYTGGSDFVFSINLTGTSCTLSFSQTVNAKQLVSLLQGIRHLNCANLSPTNRVQISLLNGEAMTELRHYMNQDNNKRLSDVFKKIIQKESSKVEGEPNKFLEKLDSEYSGEDLLKVYKCFSSNLPLLVNTVASKLRFEPSRVLFKIEGTANNVAGIKLSNTVNTFEIVLKQAREEFRKNIETRLESYKVDTVIEGDWLKVTIAPESILELSKLMADWLGVPLNRSQEDQPNESESNTMSSSDNPLNQILFGPPGTGKTYHTIEAAVKAVEPAFKWQSRSQLKAEYERLSGEKRIRFVTFHQSYGYEEFVEGLSAKTDNGEISYYQKDGVFKCIVEDAKDNRVTKITEEISDFETLWNRFLDHLSSSENGVKVNTIRTFFTVSDVDNNTVRFEKDQGESNHSLSVKTLKSIFNGEREMKGGLNPYYTALVKYLKGLAQSESEVKTSRKNYALVIDEINRGNISKIFGELITLIEPSKRKGAEEELEVTLPYSGDTFSVPDNLHIIGTMNTADRSLAMMDTALRRRFDFKEMMPQPELLEGRKVKGIDLSELLKKLNKRIEVLYDREHTLGHAFLFPVYNEKDDEKAFVELQNAFKNKIIPLLEEYFYEDWNKIRLVLGDSLKSDEALRFLTKQEDTYSDLFGSSHDLDLYEDKKITYSIKPFEGDDTPWVKPSAYIGIYKQFVSESSESEA